jgi:pentatricopeptide repeat protein
MRRGKEFANLSRATAELGWFYRQAQDSNNKIGKYLQVFVRENNVDQALRILKKKMQREGIFRSNFGRQIGGWR